MYHSHDTTKTRLILFLVFIPLGAVGLLIAGCIGKMIIDARNYELPGEVLKSKVQPTRILTTGMEVAEELDAYVQPRFLILKDKNFGAFRIRFREHAGLVQLKVDSEKEKEQIANVNATQRDYVISMMNIHNTEGPQYFNPLYVNQTAYISDFAYSMPDSDEAVAAVGLNLVNLEEQSNNALPKVLKGKEHKTKVGTWDVLMRPILASKPECLSCHTDSKLNSALAVMVYAVNEPRKPKLTKLGSSQ